MTEKYRATMMENGKTLAYSLWANDLFDADKHAQKVAHRNGWICIDVRIAEK